MEVFAWNLVWFTISRIQQTFIEMRKKSLVFTWTILKQNLKIPKHVDTFLFDYKIVTRKNLRQTVRQMP